MIAPTRGIDALCDVLADTTRTEIQANGLTLLQRLQGEAGMGNEIRAEVSRISEMEGRRSGVGLKEIHS